MADTASPAPSTFDPPPLTNAGRYIILIVAFFGWFFAGTQMAVTSIAMRAAAAAVWAFESSAASSASRAAPSRALTLQYGLPPIRWSPASVAVASRTGSP